MENDDLRHLRRCVELADEAVEAGDHAFGSVLVSGTGEVLFEDRNRTGGGDPTRHPEFAIARWAANHLDPDDRSSAVVYTSGEHCAMCAAAHGLVGLGRIVFATSTEQLTAWLEELDREPMGIAALGIGEVVPDVAVAGPFPIFADKVRMLHARSTIGKRNA